MKLPEGWILLKEIVQDHIPRERPWYWWNEGEFGANNIEWSGKGYVWVGLGPKESTWKSNSKNGPVHGKVREMGIAVLVKMPDGLYNSGEYESCFISITNQLYEKLTDNQKITISWLEEQ